MEPESQLKCAVSRTCTDQPAFCCEECSGTPVYYCERHKRTHHAHPGAHTSKPIYRFLPMPVKEGIINHLNSKLCAIESSYKKINKTIAETIQKLNKEGTDAKSYLDAEYAKTIKLKKSILKYSIIFYQDEEDLNTVTVKEIKKTIHARCKKMRQFVEGISNVEDSSPELQNAVSRKESTSLIGGKVIIKDIVYSPYASNELKINALRENAISVDIKPDKINGVIILRNKKYAIIWGKKLSVMFYDLITKQQCTEIKIPGQIQMVTATDDSSTLIISVQSQQQVELQFWDINAKELTYSNAMDSRIDFIHQFPNNRLVLYSWNSMVFFYDLNTRALGKGKVIHPPEKNTMIFQTAVTHTQDFRMIVSGGTDGRIRAYCIEDFNIHKDFKGVHTTIKCLSLTSDEKILLAGTSIGTIGVWTVDDAIKKYEVSFSKPIIGIMPAIDSSCFMAVNEVNSVKIWEMGKGKNIKELKKRCEIDEFREIFPMAECFEERLKK